MKGDEERPRGRRRAGRQRDGRITSLDVAERAGVSQSAVSRAFTPGASVAPATRARVIEAANELGYRPNALARGLITDRSNLVALVVSRPTDPFYPPIIERFGRSLQALGMHPLLIVPPIDDVDAAIPDVLQYQVDAIVITAATLSSRMAAECAKAKRPAVLFNRTTVSHGLSAICCDNAGGARMAAHFLIDGGHSRFAFVAGRRDSSTTLERETAFVARLNERGKGLARSIDGAYDYRHSHQALGELLARPDRPDAIFCGNDIMGCAAIDVARNLGLRVPEDLSIVAFNDTDPASWRAYDLTVVSQPIEEMVATTIEMITAPDGLPAEPVIKRLPVRLVVRGSARLPPGVQRSSTPWWQREDPSRRG
jgi:DNA-binding LacI/PurR family transcriptional regulator